MLEERRGKGDRESCVCDLILLFSLLLVIHYSFCKASSWRALLTFQEYRVGPSGGHFGELSSTVCQREGEMEMEKRKEETVFDQRGAESHWDVMEGLVLCDRGERKTKRQTK